MSGKARKGTGGSNFRFRDFLVIVLCLSGAAASFNLFRLDLFQTFSSRNEEPVGIIIIKNNTVQRRMADRVLWDRLVVSSPAYMGDLIRVADLSSATLLVESNQIDLGENTLIRIQRAQNGEGPIHIELSQGSLSLATGNEEGTITLNVMGHLVEAGPGTVLAAAAREGGMALQVSEGRAKFIEEEQSREIVQGTMIALDAEGTERREPAVVLTYPRPNARYLKNRPEPLPIAFAWNRLNLRPGDALRLEIASDRNFTQAFRLIEGLDDKAEAALDAGLWHWRLLYRDAVLSTGQISVAEARGPALLNPARDRLFSFQDIPPSLRFEWAEVADASHYILEASDTPDFIAPQISRQVDATFFTDSNLGPGTWYWRVMPVFPPVYEGSAAFSPAASFRIMQRNEPEEVEAWLALPELVVEQPEQRQELEAKAIPPEVRLISPDPGTTVAGLTALRQQTVFRWDCEGETERTRFIISRNANPFQGRPEVEILNPDRTIRLDRLGEGVWYWTVEAQASGGPVSAAPLRLQVLPIPLLPAPGSRQPAEGSRIGIRELKAQRSIAFRWQAVQGANAYIFTLYQQTSSGRRLVFRSPAENRTTWTMEDLRVLDNGTFIWQVEAVNLGRNRTIEQHGRIVENSFVMDIPLPGPVQLEDRGVFYVE
jgi:hypothetical protein